MTLEPASTRCVERTRDAGNGGSTDSPAMPRARRFVIETAGPGRGRSRGIPNVILGYGVEASFATVAWRREAIGARARGPPHREDRPSNVAMPSERGGLGDSGNGSHSPDHHPEEKANVH
jgi:hypothetical protein